ncbi:MAG: peptidylprolyl isomerase [Proteobacteria bacterium]|nr:peptidylprolyl isomerase [Pseudomonadota bacterium]MBU1388205.1 peptidylprolyl isomerase [Pseudomonadota bacterium]MBU1543017.1 peptidylprolyl isomerase [Pseudomonadota bacterium]MBU2431356.1 peptidylprolyl isomerase [Pseudomonadota bacterium]MBU2480504.1 peptidylprolyl isomerase [Pseudomonadota bacterium]
MTDKIKIGDTISVDYTGRLQSGKVFDSSQGSMPLVFTVGSGMLIKGFDKAVIGMKTGEKKTVVIEPEEGYGMRNEELFVDIPKVHFPMEIEPEIGMQLDMESPDGHPIAATIAQIGEATVRMDINHFLAGKTLEFDITIVETGLEPDVHACHSGSCDSGCDCHSGDTDSGCGCGSGCCS